MAFASLSHTCVMSILRGAIAAVIVGCAFTVASFVGSASGSSPPPTTPCPFLASMHGTFNGIPLHNFWIQTNESSGYQICDFRTSGTGGISISKETWASSATLPASPNQAPSGAEDAHFQTRHSGKYLITRGDYRLTLGLKQYVEFLRVSHPGGFVAIDAISQGGPPGFDISEGVALAKRILTR
jgi:hypothetical protein